MSTSVGTGRRKRYDWEENHHALRLAYLEHLKANGKAPMTRELAEACKISTKSVERHMATLRDDRSRFEKFKFLTEDVISGIATAGAKGDSKAAKLFMEIVEDFVPKKSVNVIQSNPYSQLSDEALESQIQKRANGNISDESEDTGQSRED